MSQSDTAKALAAEERTEEARSFVRRVRAATRRKYAPEENIRIVLEEFRREVTVNDLCRREGKWHQGELFPRVGFIVTNLSYPTKGIVSFYNGRGTAEQWIEEGKYAMNWT